MLLLNKLAQLPDSKRWWASIAITFIIALSLIIVGIYAVGEYGVALFVLTPLFIGFSASTLYGYKNGISRITAFKISTITTCFIVFALLLFAIEGLICIAMAAPVAILLVFIGCSLAYFLLSKQQSGISALLVLALLIPLTGFVERRTTENTVIPVTTSIKIKASREHVWKHVVEFPELGKPTELLFKAGISYPVNAHIEGKGEGAIRYCNFTTGSFIEPITTWNEPSLLAFDVQQSPQPMQELSLWDVNAPHLHDYFVSKKGQFKLIWLSENETLLEGTTWYSNKIKPAFYWRLWSDYIIHQIHNRVLLHIKHNSEKK